MRMAALHFGAEYHLLDHIAPLASLLDMPLFLNEDPSIARLCYPQVESIYWPDLNLSWGRLAERFDLLFRCGFWSPHMKQMIRDLYKKEMQFIFCPHGQSDKGYHSPLLTPYAEQEIVLLYGPLMQEMLQNLAIWPNIRKPVFVGNYRWVFYQRHRAFYDGLIENRVFSKLDLRKPVILYAPTWQDIEDSSSFFIFGRRLIDQVPSHWNLIIKPHPLLESRNPGRYYSLAAAAEQKENILLLEKFPPIYPLLEHIDVYLGDFSSVGYDFLALLRPMFFLNHTSHPLSDPSRRLHRCGLSIDLDRPYSFIEENLPRMTQWIPAQRELYTSVYADCPDIQKSVQSATSCP